MVLRTGCWLLAIGCWLPSGAIKRRLRMLKLRIISPEKLVFEGEVKKVTLPGTMGSFTVLDNHAPIISSLEKGLIKYENANGLVEVVVNSGFAEVKDNILSICVEL